MRKVRDFPMAKVTAVTTVVPYAALLRFFTQSKCSDNEFTQTMFSTTNARVLSKSAPWT